MTLSRRDLLKLGVLGGAVTLLRRRAQVAFGLLVLRGPGTLTALAGVAGNLVLAGLYLASRTNGVPVGPVHSGHRLEPAGVLDLTTTAAELLLIALLVAGRRAAPGGLGQHGAHPARRRPRAGRQALLPAGESVDSRAYGPVPLEAVVGRVTWGPDPSEGTELSAPMRHSGGKGCRQGGLDGPAT